MKKQTKQTLLAAIAFLSAWQATDFALDYRAIMGAALASLCGYVAPSKRDNANL